ncbi:hypothetical protein KP509_20G050500 [Ceratopteris richardii]|nr:hypothetical protein KP509_20G050500 [Ceratopteris richardii]
MSTQKISSRRGLWLGILISFVLVSLIGGVLWTFRASSFNSILPERFFEPLLKVQGVKLAPTPPARVKTDEEIASYVVSLDILSHRPFHSKSFKIAFMFLTRGPLPHEHIWERFFKGHESMYSVFVHASEEGHSRISPIFMGRDIWSKKVFWGKIDMIDAERRLLANALLDKDNKYFVLLSESCIPLWDFNYIYEHLSNSSISYVDCFYDPGPHGAGRYLDGMKPEVQHSDFHKGAQWFAVHRQHALLILADSLYYRKFKEFCKPGDANRNCYPDEHYVQTLLHIIDPQGISNWSVTYVDWTDQKAHPRSFHAGDINLSLLEKIKNITVSSHVTSDLKKLETKQPCLWNGVKYPCYLFARKFSADSSNHLEAILFNNAHQSADQPIRE